MMAGIRKSARLITVKGSCGHRKNAYIPAGELSVVGSRNIGTAATTPCYTCLRETEVQHESK